MNEQSLKPIIQKLESLFDFFNGKYFNNELERPIITVSPDTTIGAYGWCTSWKAWKNGNAEFYEINLCAEHLTRPYEETAGTMLHEMVHLYNLQNGVKDTSRSGTYHNKKFKEAAEEHGLIVEATEKYGYAKTKLSDKAKAELPEKESFELRRDSGSKFQKGKKSKKSSSRKYVCPCCGAIIRATKEVHIMCVDCNELMGEEI